MGTSWSGETLGRNEVQVQAVKRKREESDSYDDDNASGEDKTIQDELNTPKKKKMRSTSKYIYETLFEQGRNSDVTLVCLGQDWHLHKVYLCQCDYFSSMFSGSWSESLQDIIHIDIPDDNIDKEAMAVAFGSLYQDDVMIKPNHVVSVLAAAMLLGLDGLIQQCTSVMLETISAATVCSYRSAAQTYAVQAVLQGSTQWLEKNMLTAQSVTLLQNLSPDLMSQIVSSPDLFVIQVEMDIYSLLKKWIFLQVNPQWTGNFKHLLAEADTYFKSQKASHKRAFLETEVGCVYGEVFRGLRLCHIVNDATSTRLIEDDFIIPMSWLLPVYRDQWHQLLYLEQGIDTGPEESEHPDFGQLSLRVGRILPKDGEFCWRWTGFNYGLDLLVSVTNRLLLVKRNSHGSNCAGSVSVLPHRRFLYRISIASLDTRGQTKFIKTTGVKSLTLAKDEEAAILGIERSVSFPLHISANFLFFSPIENRISNQYQIISVGNTRTSDSSDTLSGSADTGVVEDSS